jgi:hypothetical protein
MRSPLSGVRPALDSVLLAEPIILYRCVCSADMRAYMHASTLDLFSRALALTCSFAHVRMDRRA